MAIAAGAFLLVVTALAIAAPLVTRYPYNELAFPPLLHPSAAHFMGTDDLGRDLWSRIVYGARITLAVAVASQLIALTIGVLVGGAAGLTGGLVDSLLMRITDIMQALPQLLLALLFLVALGNSAAVLTLALGLSSWPVVARITRGQVLQLREQDFVLAAYSVGSTRRQTMRTHILPNAIGPVIVQITFGVAQAIFAEAFLSFIGLGPPPPNPTWGGLIADGFSYVRDDAFLLLFPGIVLSLTLLAVNFLGDGLRDAFDPEHDR
jgi:ABC-type dipeptide/oligopeptide/nickel transport system permease subunit